MRARARVLIYAAWNSPFSKAPDWQGKVQLKDKMSKGYAAQYQFAQVEAAVHFTKTQA